MSFNSTHRQPRKRPPSPSEFLRSFGKQPQEPQAPHRIIRTCGHCPARHNVIGYLVDGVPRIARCWCFGCGHRADVPMAECDCPKCEFRRGQKATNADVEAITDWLFEDSK
jgi:hypothetical protein